VSPFPSAIADLLLSFFAPPCCASCDEVVRPRVAFCRACARTVERRRGAAPFAFGGAVAVAIRRLKYARRGDVAVALGGLLAEATRARFGRGAFDAVVPVPLHARRLAARGFNPAALLARPVARAIDAPLHTGLLFRVRDTPPQAGLGRAERLQNMQNAFIARTGSRAPARVLLVDDVVTTGATLTAAAGALASAGVRVERAALAEADDG
jgi:ComF family protein